MQKWLRIGCWVILTAAVAGVPLAFYAQLGGASTASVLRSGTTAVTVLGVWYAAGVRRWLQYLATALLWFFAVAGVSVITYTQYFHQVPTFRTLTLLPQAPAVAGQGLALAGPRLFLIVGIVLPSAWLLVAKPWRPVTWRRGLIAAASAAAAVLWPWVGIVYDSATVGRTYVADRLEYWGGQAIHEYGYLPYLWYQQRSSPRIRYDRPGTNPMSCPATAARQPSGLNILVIQMESLDRALLGFEVNGRPVTPLLNALRSNGIYFPNFFAQHAAGGSSDAEIATLTGLLPLPHEAVSVHHRTEHLPSVVKLLRKAGYSTAAFHGNTGEFWQRSSTYRQLGFESFHEQDSYTGEARGFHSLDDAFFSQSVPMLEELAGRGKPFFAYFITQTLHGPYRRAVSLPDAEWLTVPDRTVDNYLRTANYVDRALAQFLAELTQHGLLDRTVLVLFGDHQSGVQGGTYDGASPVRDNVPLVILHPRQLQATVPTYASHADLGPTLLDVAGLPADPRMIGRSVLRWAPDRLYPIRVGLDDSVVKPGGAVPFSAVLDPRYRLAVDYCRSYFFGAAEAGARPLAAALSSTRYIAHALGSIEDHAYTNSLEAFARTVGLGVTVMEVDLSWSGDGHLVCVHDGMEERLGLKQPLSEISRTRITSATADGQWTVLDADALLDLLADHPNVRLVTDTKTTLGPALAYLATAAERHGRGLASRIIPQIYGPADLPVVRSQSGFAKAVLTLYRTPSTDAEVVALVQKNRDVVQAVTVSESRFSPRLAAELRALRIPVFVHTVNRADRMNELTALGAHGFYSDLPSDLVVPVAGLDADLSPQ